jgi:hypothetical protein
MSSSCTRRSRGTRRLLRPFDGPRRRSRLAQLVFGDLHCDRHHLRGLGGQLSMEPFSTSRGPQSLGPVLPSVEQAAPGTSRLAGAPPARLETRRRRDNNGCIEVPRPKHGELPLAALARVGHNACFDLKAVAIRCEDVPALLVSWVRVRRRLHAGQVAPRSHPPGHCPCGSRRGVGARRGSLARTRAARPTVISPRFTR